MTAYPAVLLRTEYVLGGVQPASFGIWFSTTNEKTSADLQTWLNGPNLTNWNTNVSAAARAGIVNPDKVDGFTAYGYDLAGELTAQAHYTFTTGNTGTGIAGGYPQVSVVVTLETAGFGRSQRGRLYFPWTASSEDLRPADDAIDDLAAGMGTYLSTAITQGFVPIVNSRSRADGYAVTRVKIDNVADTQRRRRDQFAPTHIASAAVTGD